MSDIDKKESDAKSLANIKEINAIQKEIDKYTKYIEHEKINLRLAKERYDKQRENLTSLQNEKKPGFARKEQEGKRQLSLDVIEREDYQMENKIKVVNDEINQVEQENKYLRLNMEELRKERMNLVELLENNITINKQTKIRFEEIYSRNKHNREDEDGLLSKFT